jgi:TPP-dependent indolepyruvate ferredoxin oxidoreductase alpha subunit
VIDSPKPRLGIITSGKSYLDVRQALDDLGITEADAAEIGLRVFKIAMPWPLEPEGVRQFAEGLEEILVVEEKRQVVEYQLKEQLYNWRDDVRPRVVGKFDEKGEWVRPHGDWLLPALSELTPAMIARVIAQRIGGSTCIRAPSRSSMRASTGSTPRRRRSQNRRSRSSAFRISARAARTTRRPTCPKAAGRPRASAAT